jgi:hypothetical protein
VPTLLFIYCNSYKSPFPLNSVYQDPYRKLQVLLSRDAPFYPKWRVEIPDTEGASVGETTGTEVRGRGSITITCNSSRPKASGTPDYRDEMGLGPSEPVQQDICLKRDSDTTVRSAKRRTKEVKCKLRMKTGHAVARWVRHYATSRKVVGSTPDEVNEFFNLRKG